MRIGLGMVLALLASPAMAADQFDLKCTGTRQMALRDLPEAHEYGIRVDLLKRKWCWDHCEEVYDIEAVQPDRLVLKSEKLDNFKARSSFSNVIDRKTGRHELVSIEIRPLPSYFKIEGLCEPAPFTGFPSVKF